jgi:putative hydroxymethylpyrimidine transport system substrate-binding protein
MRKLLSLLVAVPLLLAACTTKPATPQTGTTPTPAPTTAAPTPVSVVLDWYPNAVHTFLYVAQEKGYFKEAGLDVTFKMPADNPADGLKLVEAGKETFALYYPTDLLEARAQGVKAVSYGAIVRSPLNIVMADQAKSIARPKDLEGKTVGYPSIPVDMDFVKTMVQADGGDPAKVKFQDVGFDLMPAITGKNVDAIVGGYLNHEKLLLEKEGAKLSTFNLTDFGVPSYYELILVGGEKLDPAIATKFWTAAQKGFDWTKANPKEALAILLSKQKTESPLDEAVETQSLQLLLPRMTGAGSFGSQSADDWKKLTDWMSQKGLIPATVKAEEAYRNVVK